MMNHSNSFSSDFFQLQPAKSSDIPEIMTILKDAIQQRKEEGSEQWQNGYPNEETIKNDIQNGVGYVYLSQKDIVAYVAIVFDEDPNYRNIRGNWLTHGKYVNLHRIATSKKHKRKGVATKLLKDIEAFCINHQIPSIKIDTNFDNLAMLRVLEKSGYIYCGEVMVSDAPRRAFEKILV